MFSIIDHSTAITSHNDSTRLQKVGSTMVNHDLASMNHELTINDLSSASHWWTFMTPFNSPLSNLNGPWCLLQLIYQLSPNHQISNITITSPSIYPPDPSTDPWLHRGRTPGSSQNENLPANRWPRHGEAAELHRGADPPGAELMGHP